jgi:hypothetical protein
VETYLKGMYHTLSYLTAQVIEPLDFRGYPEIWLGKKVDLLAPFKFQLTVC